MKLTTKGLTAIFACVLPVFAAAEDPVRVAEAAKALNMTEAEFRSCIPDGATADQPPSIELRSALIACLREVNPRLNNSEIRAVMMEYRN